MWVTGREGDGFKCHPEASHSETLKKGLPKPSRENTDCYGSPSEPSVGKAEKEKMEFEPLSATRQHQQIYHVNIILLDFHRISSVTALSVLGTILCKAFRRLYGG